MRTPQEDLLVVEAVVDYSHKLEDIHPERSRWSSKSANMAPTGILTLAKNCC